MLIRCTAKKTRSTRFNPQLCVPVYHIRLTGAIRDSLRLVEPHDVIPC
jgi:hypothetical protein